MDDAALVAWAIDGDQSAWAEIYDAYADRLHDYCFSIVRERHEAADVLHDAFVTAATKIGQLRDPSRLRPWLYAICRTEALASIRRRTREAPAEEIPEMRSGDDIHGEYAESELRELVSAAAGGLEARDRSVLFLHLRGGLDGRELGEALGVSAHHATVLLGRVRGHVERSLSALLVGRTGRESCPELDTLLDDWDGSLSPLVRKRIARHIDKCEVCGERRKRMVSPLALLGSVPMIPAPDDLRERTLDDLALVAARRPLGGFRRPGGRGKVWATAAAVVALLIAGGLLATLPGPVVPSVADPTVTPATSITYADGSGTATSTPKTTAVTSAASVSSTGTVPATSTGAPRSATAPAATTTAGRRATTTRRPAAEPTSEPDPPAPPVIGGLTTDRASLSPGTPCSTTSATATVTGTDVTRVELLWQQGSAAPATMEMSPDVGDTYAGRIGPITTGDPVTWWVKATDAAGNTTTSSVRTIPVRSTC